MLKYFLGLHFISAWGGAMVGSYESYNKKPKRYFSEPQDDPYTAGARGLLRGVYYPCTIISQLPNVWSSERPPFI